MPPSKLGGIAGADPGFCNWWGGGGFGNGGGSGVERGGRGGGASAPGPGPVVGQAGFFFFF